MSGRIPDLVLAAALFATLSGCQTSSPRVKASDPAAAPVAAPAAAPLQMDASFDWHVLLIAPFGSVLKEIPLGLHEVLLFQDQDPGAGPSEDGECYAADAGAPRFLASPPDEYLLCFKRDRLSRIHATVRLPDSEAPALFAASCAGWLKNDPQDSATQSAVACEGRDGVVHFSAALEAQPEATVTITLDSAHDP
jgi:hypothetical protein